MIQGLCSYMFGGHRKCKNDIHQLIQSGLEDSKKIKSLNYQIVSLLNQIEELKAINNYQTYDLEKKIALLEGEIEYLKEEQGCSIDHEDVLVKIVTLEHENRSLKSKIDELEKEIAQKNERWNKLTEPRYADIDGHIVPLGPVIVEYKNEG